MNIHSSRLAVCGLALLAGSAFAQLPSKNVTLREAYKNDFLIGAALNPGQYSGRDAAESKLAAEQFSSISPENVMKWDSLQPRPGEFRFEQADQFVNFGLKNKQFVVGHTLVWHSQAPGWIFEDNGKPVTREELLKRMETHISTVVGRYKGKVKGWDVVNEALNEDGTLRDSRWRQIIGDDYIQKAFEFAHKADPQAELYYNDYNIETGRKRDGAIALMKKLKAARAPVTGIGMQNHINLNWPPLEEIETAITSYGALGLKVMSTELDVDVLPSRGNSTSADISRREEGSDALNPYVNGLPDEVQQKLAKRYGDLFKLFVKHKKTVSRVTLWGVTDRATWLHNFPIRGRTAYPLLFDRDGKPKPAFFAVIEAAK